MNRDAWYSYFASNAERPYPHVGSLAHALDGACAQKALRETVLPLELRSALARSFEMFRVGETGEGRIVHDVKQEHGLWNEPLCEALRLYIAEEGKHARVLGEIVRALSQHEGDDAPTGRARHWIGTNGFVVVRRIAGVNTKMLVLFAAEVVGILFYGLVAERLPPCEMRTALDRIGADERGHVLFQRDYFQALAWPCWQAAVTAATTSALTVFAANHYDTLALLGISAKDLVLRAWEIVEDVMRAPDGPPVCKDHADHLNAPFSARQTPRGPISIAMDSATRAQPTSTTQVS